VREQLFPSSVCVLILSLLPCIANAQSLQTALTTALRGSPATGIVVDVQTGHHLATVNATNTQATPGSILKPLFLAPALQQQQVLPTTTVFCRRDLHIRNNSRDWNLACTHPQTTTALAAREALAYSCNQYFAQLADRIPPEQIPSVLERYGLPRQTPHTREQKQLLVLGLSGISVSPEQMATAYRKLALQLDDPKLKPVRDGLKDSVDYGMAHNASVAGMEIAGKTGTAADAPHGWFAGIAHLEQADVAIVIYLPHGNGADAATLAQHFFAAAKSPATGSARDLTIELFSTRTLKSLTAVGSDHSQLPIDWKPDGLRLAQGKPVQQLNLSGTYHLEDVAASGQWSITWRPEGIRVLLTLPSEDYVAAALNGEAAPDEPPASLRAMAIAMRTFALEHANRHSAEGFGLCDSTHCQALLLRKPRPEIEQAVRETAGETLWFQNQRAHIYYTQHCGGMSETAGAVWPAEQATYLAAHKDNYCLRRGNAEWQTRIPLTQLSEIFRKQGWRTPSPIASIRVARRTASGRAQLLAVTGNGAPAQLSASSFRFAVDRALGWNQMRSDWYDLKSSANSLEINGRGYGHGVGLCQAGAYQMAAEGQSETDILRFYFPGTTAGITPGDHGWRNLQGAGWTLRTTSPATNLIQQGNAAWQRAQSLFGTNAPVSPTVQEMPTTELFRQTTNQPGWMLASTRGRIVILQPAAIRQANGGTETLLLHEFLHVLIEQQARESAPLWLREGLVETLSGQNQPNQPLDLTPDELNAALARPATAAASRHAHSVAARMAAQLRARYGMPAVRQFLQSGVPSGVAKTLGS
jgi:stage II sporulation protein D (peptidoglycan lytic transglycosylase)